MVLDPEKKNAIYNKSPKLVKLINTIRELDQKDRATGNGKLFKHFIFSDVKDGYGAKLIASALHANGFTHCFKKKTGNGYTITEPHKNGRDETFGLLMKGKLFKNTDISPSDREHILKMYNERNQKGYNVHGDVMRFIILDSHYKEGLDLFDVKYVHLF